MKNGWTEKIEKLEKENTELKETIKNLRWEGDEYQRKLDNIDLKAMWIQQYAEEIREKI